MNMIERLGALSFLELRDGRLHTELGQDVTDELLAVIAEKQARSLYEITGDIKDINTLLIPRTAIEQAEKQRFELIGHADLGINNIYIFNGYGEEVPDGRTPIYAGYTNPPEAPVQVEHCIWARNGNTPCPHTAAPVQEPSLSKMDVAEAIKTLCAIGELPDSFEDVADWVAAGEIPTPPAAPVQELEKAAAMALDAIAASGDFLFNWHDCEPNNEREMDGYSEVLALNEKAFNALRKCLLTPAAQRQWVGLTDDEIHDIYDQLAKEGPYSMAVTRRKVGRAIEAKLREKNGGQA